MVPVRYSGVWDLAPVANIRGLIDGGILGRDVASDGGLQGFKDNYGMWLQWQISMATLRCSFRLYGHDMPLQLKIYRMPSFGQQWGLYTIIYQILYIIENHMFSSDFKTPPPSNPYQFVQRILDVARAYRKRHIPSLILQEVKEINTAGTFTSQLNRSHWCAKSFLKKQHGWPLASSSVGFCFY